MKDLVLAGMETLVSKSRWMVETKCLLLKTFLVEKKRGTGKYQYKKNWHNVFGFVPGGGGVTIWL